MEKQYDAQLKYIQVDRDGEFKPLIKTFTQCGSHCLTCPHKSTQNGAMESKCRCIVERGIALILQSSLPKSYWIYIFRKCISNEQIAQQGVRKCQYLGAPLS